MVSLVRIKVKTGRDSLEKSQLTLSQGMMKKENAIILADDDDDEVEPVCYRTMQQHHCVQKNSSSELSV
jgi:hypothetical protein